MSAREEGVWAFGLGALVGLCLSLALVAADVIVRASTEPQFLEPKCTIIRDYGRLVR